MDLGQIKKIGTRTVAATAVSFMLSMTVPLLTSAAMGQDIDEGQPGMGSLDDYVHEGEDDFPHSIAALGIEVTDGASRLESGALMRGPTVVRVAPDSPAARAGVESERNLGKAILMGTLIAGAFVFPPAFFGVIVVSQSEIGESHDTIVAVDSQRTRSVRELERMMSRSGAGPIVYLSLIHRGHRENLRLSLPMEGGETE